MYKIENVQGAGLSHASGGWGGGRIRGHHVDRGLESGRSPSEQIRTCLQWSNEHLPMSRQTNRQTDMTENNTSPQFRGQTIINLFVLGIKAVSCCCLINYVRRIEMAVFLETKLMNIRNTATLGDWYISKCN